MNTISVMLPVRSSFLILIIPTLLAVFLTFEDNRLKQLIRPIACKYGGVFVENTSLCKIYKPRVLNKYSLRKLGTQEVSYFVEPIERGYLSENDHEMMLIPPPELSPGRTRNNDNVFEALATLDAAVEFRKQGKFEKARRVLDHAVALAPTHPDVLTELGLYMETVQNNVVDAQSMYTKALVYNPYHSGAMSNRQRTLPLVEAIDNRMLRDIDEKRKWFLKIPRWNPSLRRAMRESYFQHVYNTVALEGNTMTLIQTRSILETHVAVGGKSIVEHNEILGMDAALRYLNSSLVHRIGEITIQDILEIHKRVLGFVDPMQAGVFRNTQVYVGGFTPVEPQNVRHEMNEFIQWLNSEESFRIHPVELAALAHYKFVYIHPFVDGNGRTSRLLMNLILMEAGYPPVIIFVEDRLRYYETLKMANDGDLRPFIRFIASCTDKALDHYLNSVTVGATDQRTDELPARPAEIDGDRITTL